MKHLLLALLLVGCSADVTTTCPQVECAWSDAGTCSEQYASTSHDEQLDPQTFCHIHDASCVPLGTPAECVPQACHRTIADCQPTGEARMGRP